MQHGIKFTYMAEIGVPSITKANEQVADQPIVDQANCNQVCVLMQRPITVHALAPQWHDVLSTSACQQHLPQQIPVSTPVSRSNLQCSWSPAAGRSDWLAEGTHSRPWGKNSWYDALVGGCVSVLQGVAEGKVGQRGGVGQWGGEGGQTERVAGAVR